ncbi:MAG TPA: hypothetical protein VFC78_02785 [Tepidisphaeraceae bacterium]|nr:hypothetical protein [Tepidisphaeraceae bacterium]
MSIVDEIRAREEAAEAEARTAYAVIVARDADGEELTTVEKKRLEALRARFGITPDLLQKHVEAVGRAAQFEQAVTEGKNAFQAMKQLEIEIAVYNGRAAKLMAELNRERAVLSARFTDCRTQHARGEWQAGRADELRKEFPLAFGILPPPAKPRDPEKSAVQLREEQRLLVERSAVDSLLAEIKRGMATEATMQEGDRLLLRKARERGWAPDLPAEQPAKAKPPVMKEPSNDECIAAQRVQGKSNLGDRRPFDEQVADELKLMQMERRQAANPGHKKSLDEVLVSH